MLKIKNNKKQQIPSLYKIENLIQDNYDEKKNAFIGKVGLKENLDSYENELYIITYSCIFLASDPSETFDSKMVAVYVEKFVDLEIKIIDKE